jgi:hypothetical protein
MFVCAFILCLPRVEAGKNTYTVIPASRKRRQKGNAIVSGETVPADLRKRIMRTYHWISLFKSYIETANYLIESKVILIANKRVKKSGKIH